MPIISHLSDSPRYPAPSLELQDFFGPSPSDMQAGITHSHHKDPITVFKIDIGLILQTITDIYYFNIRPENILKLLWKCWLNGCGSMNTLLIWERWHVAPTILTNLIYGNIILFLATTGKYIFITPVSGVCLVSSLHVWWRVACSILFHGVFMCSRCQQIKNICKQRSYLLFLPNSMPFIINSVILSLQLDRDIWNYMSSMA